MHLDICPAMIEVMSAVTVKEWQYDMDGRFVEKVCSPYFNYHPFYSVIFQVVLQCSRIRLVFYGSAGVRTERSIGTDQYRAPELVFGQTDVVLWLSVVLTFVF